MPIVSVLMGVYYRRTNLFFLKRSLQSILAQSISDLEVLICDDGSTDEAREYLTNMATQDPRIRLIRKGHLFSLPEKLNACLAQATAPLIARMDDDDRCAPERFQCQIQFLETHPEIDFVGCCADLERNGALVGTRMLPEYPDVPDFFMTQPYLHPALMFRKQVLDAVNGYSEEKRCILCEDYDLLLRLYRAGYRGANLQERLLTYTLPDTAKGNRKMRHRWNETVTRWIRFKELGVLPRALPFVVKPLVVGLIPGKILAKIRK